MATIKKRKIGKQSYYYVEHSFKLGRRVKVLSKYLGKNVPYNIDDIKDNLEHDALRLNMLSKLKSIKASYKREQSKLPKQEREKLIEDFLVHFIYDSSKIEGSSLTLNDTKGLFLHNIMPKSKPAKDVKEAEGYRKAFYSMIDFKGKLRLQVVNKWHEIMFKDAMDYIAGKIRLHKITVTGSRASFPHPEDVPKLLKGFFGWYKKEQKKLNPIELAALAHLKFVSIHPYSDGNGRISRLLANYVLKSHGCPMLNIKFNDRAAYYRSLESSQTNEKPKYFVRFFARRYLKENKRLV
ncbi:Fic family protein [Candidatus Woesearchaeota archaeon]|nr:Fic family protein [Candidatus Woesearchaeota archaeon]